MKKYRLNLLLSIGLYVTTTAALASMKETILLPETISFNAIPVCYDFDCKNSAVVTFSKKERQDIRNRFRTVATTPAEERQQIRQAIGWMEVLIGRHTPTYKDIAFNLPAKNKKVTGLFPGQQDCIDEAFNTTVYLKLLEKESLLKHHKVIQRAYRKSIWDQHWAGHIEELDSGKKYVVDSWFQPNGYLPVVQSSKEWHDVGLLTALVDDSSREGKNSSFWRKIISVE